MRLIDHYGPEDVRPGETLKQSSAYHLEQVFNVHSV